MTRLDQALQMAETRMLLAIPNPQLWSGAASMACAEAIERLAHELHDIQIRLHTWQW